MPESSLRFRLVIARASDSTPGDVSGIVTRLHTDTELVWLLSAGDSSYLDTLCRALSGDETLEGFEAVPADHELYDPEAQRYFAPPLPAWYRAGVLVHPVVPSTETT